MVTKREAYQQAEAALQQAKQAIADAQARYDALRAATLLPGELRPGVYEVMIRRTPKQKYQSMQVPTPAGRDMVPGGRLLFSNNKSATITGVVYNEVPGLPLFWLTVAMPAAKHLSWAQFNKRQALIEAARQRAKEAIHATQGKSNSKGETPYQGRPPGSQGSSPQG